jgi:hypothetical protein
MAATGHTIYVTYQLSDSPYSASTNYGHSKSLHCAHIQEMSTNTLVGKTLNMYFPSANDFSFMNVPTGATAETGFTATNLYALVQIVSGMTGTTANTANWNVIELTSQITNHTVGQPIDPVNLADTIFNVDPVDLTTGYTLSYLNYPNSLTADDEKLAFGEEVFFFGNVKSDFKSTAYITDIPIELPLNEFNSTTNPTWDGVSSVSVSEIGIYNTNGDLVAIGKINDPIEKNSTIGRTLLFGMDF